MLLSKEKETRVKFNRGLSANRPSNNWALKLQTANGNLKFQVSHQNLMLKVCNEKCFLSKKM